MAMRALCTVALLLGGAAVGWTALYDGYQVVSAVPTSVEQLLQLRGLENSALKGHLDTWKVARTVNDTMDIMVSSPHAKELRNHLKALNIQHKIMIHDVQQLLDSETTGSRRKRATGDVLTAYSSYADILAWLDQIARTCGSRCSVETVGSSALGLPLKVIKVSGSTPVANKKAIFVDGTFHAREWISTTMSLNIINKLVVDYHTDSATKRIVDAFDWYIFPVVNPDGYEYTRSTNRLWRKTRGNTSNKSCPGTDLNRNFDFHWLESGASTNPCDETFAGSVPFSEPESRALRDYILGLQGRVTMYLSLHAYGQYWLYSWGYSTVQAPDTLEMKALATIGANAVRSASTAMLAPTTYVVGSAAGALYASAGGSDDWAKGVAGIKYSYTVELPPRDSALNGFVLAESKIPQVVKETWAGIKAVAEELTVKQVPVVG